MNSLGGIVKHLLHGLGVPGRWAGVLVILALVVGGCGSGGEGEDDAGTDGVDGAIDGAIDGEGGLGEDSGPVTAPMLSDVTARQVGRFGDDLRLDFTSDNRDETWVAVRVALWTLGDEPVLLNDTDGDGSYDAQEVVIPLPSTPPKQESAAAFVRIARAFFDHPRLTRARVARVDADGGRSPWVDATVASQTVLALGESCDASYLENRCGPNLGCKGSGSPTCQDAEAPVITRVGYHQDPLGPRILVEGTDPDDDVSAYTISFFDLSDEPIALDLDGDGIDESTSFDAMLESTFEGGEFFFRFLPSDYFIERVAKIGVQVRDMALFESNTMTAVREPAPTRASGQSCDPRAFNRCNPGFVCNPGIVGATNRCTAVSAARNTACTTAVTLDADRGLTSVRGNIGNPSLWDAPGGCTSGDPVLQPERVVKLLVPRPAQRIVLSTANDVTNFDSVLYVLTACTSEPPLAWCADDQESVTRPELAVLELTDVAAGTYFVVVDSFPSGAGGTRFQLDLTVEE